MFSFGYASRVALLILACAVAGGERASAQSHPKSRDELLDAARRIIASARFAMLVTVDAEGQPQARMMDPFAPDSQMVIWIGTNPRSRKVAEVEKEARVALSYFDAASLAYVTITGRAHLVDDPEEKAQRFKPEWAGIYPNRAQDYVLLKVTPERLELISEREGVGFTDSLSWRPPVVKF
jgi:general stress protein 26